MFHSDDVVELCDGVGFAAAVRLNAPPSSSAIDNFATASKSLAANHQNRVAESGATPINCNENT